MTSQFQSGASKSDQKRSRSSNFSKEKELLLLQEVTKFKDIIECKVTIKVTTKEKEEAWAKIAIAYNCNKEAQVRKIEQLQSKYDNLRTKTRKVVAELRKYLHGTGGGPAHYDTLDPVVEAILKIINYKTVVGLQFNLDSDYVENGSVGDLMEVPYSSSDPYKENIIPTLAVNSTKDEVFEIEYLSTSPMEVVSNAIGTRYESNSISLLKEPTCQKINHSTVAHLHEATKEIQTDNNTTDWGNYTPLQLKKRTSKQLRPTVTNPLFLVKQDYYKLKMELLNKADKRQQMEFEKKQEYEAEEHKQKVILLNLQIEEMKKNCKRNN